MKLFKTICILLLCVKTFAQASETYQVYDDIGNLVTLEQPAKRIISLAPHLTEILFAIGAGESIIGVSAYTNYPEAAKSLPAVSDHVRIDLEAVLDLRPDLIVVWQVGNPQRDLAQLAEWGIPIYYNAPKTLMDVATFMQHLGVLTAQQTQAEAVATTYLQEYEALLAQYSKRPLVTVFYQVWQQPMRTVNQHSVITQVIELCGGVNIFADASVLVPQVNVEAIFERDPQVVLTGDDQLVDWQAWWLQWPQLQAVANGHLYTIPADLVHRYSPRVLQGANIVCQHLEQVRSTLQ